MPKYKTPKEAIELFQHGGADAPILFAMTKVNRRSFWALLDRNLKSPRRSALTWIGLLAVLLSGSVFVIEGLIYGMTRFAYSQALMVFLSLALIFFPPRIYATYIVVRDSSLDFYFSSDPSESSKIKIYDKLSLPYDQITGIQMRLGSYCTKFTFELSNDDKRLRIKTTVPDRVKKMKEQEENVDYLIQTLKRKRPHVLQRSSLPL